MSILESKQLDDPRRMFRALLVPLDGTPLAEHALPFALGIARQTEAAVHVALVHVPDSYSEYAHVEELDEQAKSRERDYLSSLRRRLATLVKQPIHFHHLEGIVPETLVEEVFEQSVDLVVMNAHSWSQFARAIVGSVSDFLMRHLNVPLLVLHEPEDGAELSRVTSLGRILVCLDGSPLGETILKPAEHLGQIWKSRYRLLRVVPRPVHWIERAPSGASFPDGAEAEHAEALDYLESVARPMRARGLDVETCVVAHSSVVTGITEAAQGCDVVALSTHGRGGLERLILGSVADKVIRATRRPVLVYNACAQGG